MEVLNKKVHGVPRGAVYVGRPTKWGNPFVIGPDGDRDEVVRKYEDWARSRPRLVEAARRELAGHDLVCWCAPQRCHADVLKAIASEDDEGLYCEVCGFDWEPDSSGCPFH